MRLLELRCELLVKAEQDLEIATKRVVAARAKAAAQKNEASSRKFRLEKAIIAVKDLVLVYDNVRKIDMSSFRKL